MQAPEAGSGHSDRTFWVPGAWKLAWQRDVGSVGPQPWPVAFSSLEKGSARGGLGGAGPPTALGPGIHFLIKKCGKTYAM